MHKLLTFLIALGAIVFAIVSLACAQPPFDSFPPGVFQNRGAIDAGSCTNHLTIDGTPQVSQSALITQVVTISTANNNDVIVVLTWHNGGNESGSPPISDTAGLTWTLRGNVTANNTKSWYAIAPSALTADVISMHYTAAVTGSIAAFAVTGANTSSPWDPNVALPNLTTSGNGSITTTNPCTMPIFLVKNNSGSPTAGAGWTQLVGSGFTLMEYQKVTAPQSALAATQTIGTTVGAIADALTQ
jgi:hypothetical protein